MPRMSTATTASVRQVGASTPSGRASGRDSAAAAATVAGPVHAALMPGTRPGRSSYRPRAADGYPDPVVAALECYFDSQASRRIRAVWDALESVGVPSLRDLTHGRHRPHVSLAVADRLDPVAVADALAGTPAYPPSPVSLDYVGQFVGRVLWLGPVPTAGLLDHHAAVHARLAR